MTREEIENIYAITRQVCKEEIKLAIESLSSGMGPVAGCESKPETEEVVTLKEEVEENV